VQAPAGDDLHLISEPSLSESVQSEDPEPGLLSARLLTLELGRSRQKISRVSGTRHKIRKFGERREPLAAITLAWRSGLVPALGSGTLEKLEVEL